MLAKASTFFSDGEYLDLRCKRNVFCFFCLGVKCRACRSVQDGCVYEGVSDMHKMAQPPSHLTLRQLIPQTHTQAALSAHTKTLCSAHELTCAHKQRQCRGSHWLTCHKSIFTYGSRQSVSEQRFLLPDGHSECGIIFLSQLNCCQKKRGYLHICPRVNIPNGPPSFCVAQERLHPVSLSAAHAGPLFNTVLCR